MIKLEELVSKYGRNKRAIVFSREWASMQRFFHWTGDFSTVSLHRGELGNLPIKDEDIECYYENEAFNAIIIRLKDDKK